MKLDAIKVIARQHNIKVGKATKSYVIRAIQNSEGNAQCFGSNSSIQCGQSNCLWREDCD